jgi:type VI secretion system protein ImpH
VGFENRSHQQKATDLRGDLVELMFSLVGLRRHSVREQLDFPTTPLLRHLLAVAGCHRSHSALVEILTAFFPEIPSTVQEFAPTYLKIEPDQATACNSKQPSPANSLGIGTVVGDVITDYQSKFRICLGPISYRDFQSFLPGGRRYRELTDLVKFVVGVSAEFDVQFIIAKEDIPPVELKTKVVPGTTSRTTSTFQMGRNTWLSSKPLSSDRDDPVFQVKT